MFGHSAATPPAASVVVLALKHRLLAPVVCVEGAVGEDTVSLLLQMLALTCLPSLIKVVK